VLDKGIKVFYKVATIRVVTYRGRKKMSQSNLRRCERHTSVARYNRILHRRAGERKNALGVPTPTPVALSISVVSIEKAWKGGKPRYRKAR